MVEELSPGNWNLQSKMATGSNLESGLWSLTNHSIQDIVKDVSVFEFRKKLSVFGLWVMINVDGEY